MILQASSRASGSRFALEVGAGASSSSSRDVGAGLLLLQGYGASCRDGRMADGGWLDSGRSSFGGGCRRWRAQIQELEEAGRSPGRWATADDFFNFDSFQSQRAMGLLQFMGMLVFFFGGGSRRRG